MTRSKRRHKKMKECGMCGRKHFGPKETCFLCLAKELKEKS